MQVCTCKKSLSFFAPCRRKLHIDQACAVTPVLTTEIIPAEKDSRSLCQLAVMLSLRRRRSPSCSWLHVQGAVCSQPHPCKTAVTLHVHAPKPSFYWSPLRAAALKATMLCWHAMKPVEKAWPFKIRRRCLEAMWWTSASLRKSANSLFSTEFGLELYWATSPMKVLDNSGSVKFFLHLNWYGSPCKSRGFFMPLVQAPMLRGPHCFCWRCQNVNAQNADLIVDLVRCHAYLQKGHALVLVLSKRTGLMMVLNQAQPAAPRGPSTLGLHQLLNRISHQHSVIQKSGLLHTTGWDILHCIT